MTLTLRQEGGKLTAEAITGKIESKDRDGKDRSRDWTAKIEAAK